MSRNWFYRYDFVVVLVVVNVEIAKAQFGVVFHVKVSHDSVIKPSDNVLSNQIYCSRYSFRSVKLNLALLFRENSDILIHRADYLFIAFGDRIGDHPGTQLLNFNRLVAFINIPKCKVAGQSQNIIQVAIG